jgi:hypothetical protein
MLDFDKGLVYDNITILVKSTKKEIPPIPVKGPKKKRLETSLFFIYEAAANLFIKVC